MSSNIEKGLQAAERVESWVAEIEASGQTNRFIRQGRLNKSLVADTLEFPRSAWRSNPRLKVLSKRLDEKWGTVETDSALLGRLEAVIADHCSRNALLPNADGALLLLDTLAEASITPSQFQHSASVRRRLSDYAENAGLVLGKLGSITNDDETSGEALDPAEMVPAKRLREAQLRLNHAERKLAELRAENASLRAQIARANEVTELIAFGGRTAPSGVR